MFAVRVEVLRGVMLGWACHISGHAHMVGFQICHRLAMQPVRDDSCSAAQHTFWHDRHQPANQHSITWHTR